MEISLVFVLYPKRQPLSEKPGKLALENASFGSLRLSLRAVAICTFLSLMEGCSGLFFCRLTQFILPDSVCHLSF